ncbi:MAG: porphobilinogen synthase, partial [Pseudomonadota bacterium]
MVAENVLTPADFIWPCFVIEGEDAAEPVETMPGVERLSIDRLVAKAAEAADLGIPALAIFPNTADDKKTPDAEEAWNPDNLVNRATRAVKAAVPGIGVMLDVAL